MAQLSPDLRRTISERHGIVTLDQLLADEWSTEMVANMVESSMLVRIHRTVFRMATSPDTFLSRCVAASSADREAVVTGLAAAWLWDFRHVPRPSQPLVMVSHDRSPMSRGVKLRRTNVLETEDVVERADGIRIASPPRTWFDCARDVDDERFERITEWVIDHHAAVPTLWRTARRLEARGRDGLARVRRVMSQCGDWQRPAGSGLELRVLNALERRGVGPLVRQHRIELRNGIVIHPDGADPSVMWAIEVDHVTWHGGRFEAQRDKARDRNARRIGWQIDRVTDQELAADFSAAIDDLVEMYELRKFELAA